MQAAGHQQQQPLPRPQQSYSHQQQQPQTYADRSAAARGGQQHIAQYNDWQHDNGTGATIGSHPPTNEGRQYGDNNMNTNSNSNSDHKFKPKSESSVLGGGSLLQAAEQTRLLQAATQNVTERAYHMQRAMECDDVCAVLDNACLILEELGDPNHGVHHKGMGGMNRGGGGLSGGAPGGPPSFYSGAGGGVPPLGNYGDRPLLGQDSKNRDGGWIAPLTPKNYYELHIRVMDEMPSLEEYLLRLCEPRFYSASVLYETVQYCPRVVPRLYLQICMGAVSMRVGSSSVVSVMEELGEATKCVQCPVRGLFLRYYLLMALKDKLPDGSLGDEEDGSEAEEIATNAGENIAPPSQTHVDAPTYPPPLPPPPRSDMPTSPPPSLPPPPPPAIDGPLFPESDRSDAPLFSDEPLWDEPKSITSAPPPFPPPPPPATDGPLFPPSDRSDAPLFSEEPLWEEPKNTASALSPSQSESITPAIAAKDTIRGPLMKDITEPRIGTVVDSYEFILRNLIEMNRLWIRIQHMPGDNTKEVKRRRERERNDLRILVGSNLNRLSQLEGISAHTYGSKILPRILEEIASCRDPLAQAYLMDCIIQVFPDEYHLETLEVFLGVCPRLREKVNVRTILNNMMERLLHYYEEKLVNDEEDTNSVKATMAVHSFDMFEDCVHRYFEARGLNIPAKDIIRLQACLLNYALKIVPHDTDIVSRCISHCARALGTLQEQKLASMVGQSLVLGGGARKSGIDMEAVAITELEKMLSVSLNSLGLKVLDLPDFTILLAILPWENRRQVAISIVMSVIGEDDLGTSSDTTKVRDSDMLERLLIILAPLVRDEVMAIPKSTMYNVYNAANLMTTLGISTSTIEGRDHLGHGYNSLDGGAEKLGQLRHEQFLLAKLVYALYHENTDVMYQMLSVMRRHIELGGATQTVAVLPSIVFSALGLLRRVQVLEFPAPYCVPQVKEVSDEASAVEKQPESVDAEEEYSSSKKVIASTDEVKEGSEQSHAKEEGPEEVITSPNENKVKTNESNCEAAKSSGFSKSAK